MLLLRVIIDTPRRLLRRAYEWTIHWADSPQGLTALFFIALAESSFFPIPPDVLLIAVVAARPSRWLQAAVACSAGSLLGAAIGYAIGSALMVTVGQAIISFYGAEHHWDRFVELADVWGTWFLAAAAFTPIPFKVATIASGAIKMPFWAFLLVSLLGRAARFFLVATILRLFGARVRRTLEEHFDAAALLFFVLLVGGFVVLRFL
jgi:membrane protein YqaA with SNARE-associated domain